MPSVQITISLVFKVSELHQGGVTAEAAEGMVMATTIARIVLFSIAGPGTYHLRDGKRAATCSGFRPVLQALQSVESGNGQGCSNEPSDSQRLAKLLALTSVSGETSAGGPLFDPDCPPVDGQHVPFSRHRLHEQFGDDLVAK